MRKALAITFSSFSPTLFISCVQRLPRYFHNVQRPGPSEVNRTDKKNSGEFPRLQPAQSIQYFHAVQSLLTDISNYVALP